MRIRRTLLLAVIPLILARATALNVFLATDAPISSAQPQPFGLSASSGAATPPSIGPGPAHPQEASAFPIPSGPEVPAYAERASLPARYIPESPAPSDTVELLLAKTEQVSGDWRSQTLFSQQVPTTTTSPRFWGTPLANPAVAVAEIDGEEIISMSRVPMTWSMSSCNSNRTPWRCW